MTEIRHPELVKTFDDPEATDRNFDKIKDFMRTQLDRAPFLVGRLIEGQVLAASGTTQVAHKLGRPYRGWWVCGGALNGDYPGEGTSDDDTKFLALTVTGAQTVNLWVY